MINHKITRLVFAFSVGILLAVYAFRSVTDPEPARQRALEEAAVYAARDRVGSIVAPNENLEMVDPLAPDRVVGKSYIYPVEGGWQVSGYYRRPSDSRWHPFLASLNQDLQLLDLSVRDPDPGLAEKAVTEPRLTISQ